MHISNGIPPTIEVVKLKDRLAVTHSFLIKAMALSRGPFALASLLCATSRTAGFQVVDLDAGTRRTAAVTLPYSMGAAASVWAGAGAGVGPWSERLWAGGSLSTRSPAAVGMLLTDARARVDCPRQVGPFNDSASGAPVYYCGGRAQGVCDRRTGACSCFEGAAGASCDSCSPGWARVEGAGTNNTCTRVVRCPGDCAEGGTCDLATGVCTCVYGRTGDDCALRACRLLDRRCAACGAHGCTRCDDGFFLERTAVGPEAGDAASLPPRCRSCTIFDPRCAACSAASGCTACADPDLSGARRSGRRRADAPLPVDEESARVLGAEVGERADLLFLASDGDMVARAGVVAGGWVPASACARAAGGDVSAAIVDGDDGSENFDIRRYLLACSGGAPRRDIYFGYGLEGSGRGSAGSIDSGGDKPVLILPARPPPRALVPSMRLLASLRRFRQALHGLAGAMPRLRASGAHPVLRVDVRAGRGRGGAAPAASLALWLAAVADVLMLCTVASSSTVGYGGKESDAAGAQALLDAGLLDPLRPPWLETPVYGGASSGTRASAADTLFVYSPAAAWSEVPNCASAPAPAPGSPMDSLSYAVLYAGIESSSVTLPLAAAGNTGSGSLLDSTELAQAMAPLQAHGAAASNTTVAMIARVLMGHSDGAVAPLGRWSATTATARVTTVAARRPLMSPAAERAAMPTVAAALAALIIAHRALLLAVLAPSAEDLAAAAVAAASERAAASSGPNVSVGWAAFASLPSSFVAGADEGVAPGTLNASWQYLCKSGAATTESASVVTTAVAQAMIDSALAALVPAAADTAPVTGGGGNGDERKNESDCDSGLVPAMRLLLLRPLSRKAIATDASGRLLLSDNFRWSDTSLPPQVAADSLAVLPLNSSAPRPDTSGPALGYGNPADSDIINGEAAEAASGPPLLRAWLPVDQPNSGTLAALAMSCDGGLSLLPLSAAAAASGALPSPLAALSPPGVAAAWLANGAARETFIDLARFYLAGAGPTAADDPLISGLLAAWDEALGDSSGAAARRHGLLGGAAAVGAALASLGADAAEAAASAPPLRRMATAATVSMAPLGTVCAVFAEFIAASGAGARSLSAASRLSALSRLAQLHHAHSASFVGAAAMALPAAVVAATLAADCAGPNGGASRAVTVLASLALASLAAPSGRLAPSRRSLATADVITCRPAQVSHVVCGAPGVFAFAAPRYAIGEGDGLLRIAVVRSGGGLGRTSVVVALSHGTTSDSDVALGAGASALSAGDARIRLTFEPGVIQVSFLVTIFDDAEVEGISDAATPQYLELDDKGNLVCDASAARVVYGVSADSTVPAAGRPAVAGLDAVHGAIGGSGGALPPLIDGPATTSSSFSRLYALSEVTEAAAAVVAASAEAAARAVTGGRGSSDVLHNSAKLSASVAVVDGDSGADAAWAEALGLHEYFYVSLHSPSYGSSVDANGSRAVVAILDDDADAISATQSSAMGDLAREPPPSSASPARGCAGVRTAAAALLAAGPFAAVGDATELRFSARDKRGEAVRATRLSRLYSASMGAPGNGTQLVSLHGAAVFVAAFEPAGTTSAAGVNAQADFDEATGAYIARMRSRVAGLHVLAAGSARAGGLRGEYFANARLAGAAAVTRIDAFIAFDWRAGATFLRAPCAKGDDAAVAVATTDASSSLVSPPMLLLAGAAATAASCSGAALAGGTSVRWTGFIAATDSLVDDDGSGRDCGERRSRHDVYDFTVNSVGGGVRLWVDGVLLVDTWDAADDTKSFAGGDEAGAQRLVPSIGKEPVAALSVLLDDAGLRLDERSDASATANCCRLPQTSTKDVVATQAGEEHELWEALLEGRSSGAACALVVSSAARRSAVCEATTTAASSNRTFIDYNAVASSASAASAELSALEGAVVAALALPRVAGGRGQPSLTRHAHTQSRTAARKHDAAADAVRSAWRGGVSGGDLSLRTPRAAVKLAPAGSLHAFALEFRRHAAASAGITLAWITPGMRRDASVIAAALRARAAVNSNASADVDRCNTFPLPGAWSDGSSSCSSSNSSSNNSIITTTTTTSASTIAAKRLLLRLALSLAPAPQPVPSHALYTVDHTVLATPALAVAKAADSSRYSPVGATPSSCAGSGHAPNGSWPAAALEAATKGNDDAAAAVASLGLRRSPAVAYVIPGPLATSGLPVLPRTGAGLLVATPDALTEALSPESAASVPTYDDLSLLADAEALPWPSSARNHWNAGPAPPPASFALGSGLHSATPGLAASFIVLARDALGNSRGTLAALDTEAVRVSAVSLLCDPLITTAVTTGGGVRLLLAPRCALATDDPILEVAGAGVNAVDGSRLFAATAAMHARADAVVPRPGAASLRLFLSRCSPAGARAAAEAAAAASNASAAELAVIAMTAFRCGTTVSHCCSAPHLPLQRSVVAGEVTFDPALARVVGAGALAAAWAPLLAGAHAVSVTVRDSFSGVQRHIIGSPFVVPVAALALAARVPSHADLRGASGREAFGVTVNARLSTAAGSGTAADAAGAAPGATLVIAIQLRDSLGNPLTLDIGDSLHAHSSELWQRGKDASGRMGASVACGTCDEIHPSSLACAQECRLASAKAWAAEDDSAMSEDCFGDGDADEPEIVALALPSLATSGAKLLPATHPALRRIAVVVRVAPADIAHVDIAPSEVAAAGAGGGSGKFSKLPVKLLALALPLLPRVNNSSAADGTAAAGDCVDGDLLIGGARIAVAPSPGACSSRADGYLELAGLNQGLRAAAVAARATAHAIVWLAAFSTQAAGHYSVAVAMAASEEHIGSSPWLITVADTN